MTMSGQMCVTWRPKPENNSGPNTWYVGGQLQKLVPLMTFIYKAHSSFFPP